MRRIRAAVAAHGRCWTENGTPANVIMVLIADALLRKAQPIAMTVLYQQVELCLPPWSIFRLDTLQA